MESYQWLIPVVVIAEIQESAEASRSQAERARVNGRRDAFLQEHGHLVAWWDAETSPSR